MSYLDRAIALNETRKQVWAESQAFLDKLDDSTEMSAEERAQWDRYNERMDSLGEERDELLAKEKTEREGDQVRAAQEIAFGQDVNHDLDVRTANDHVRQFLMGEVRNEMHDDGRAVNAIGVDVMSVARERELLRSGASPEEVRQIVWDTGSSASTVPTELSRRLYEYLEANIAALRMPTTRITTDSGHSMEFPKVTAHAIATTVSGQGTTLAGTDPTFDKITIGATKYAQLIKLSSEVVSDTGVDLVGFVSRDLGRAVGRLVNTALMTTYIGTAWVGASGTASTGGSLIGPTFSNLVDLEYSINDAYRASGCAWAMQDSTAGLVRKLRDGAGGTEGAPLWQPSLQGGISGLRTPDTLFGYPVFTDPTIAAMASNAKIMYFGDQSAFYVRTVGNMMVERNDSVGFDSDMVHFRGKWRAAAAAIDVNAVNVMKASVS